MLERCQPAAAGRKALAVKDLKSRDGVHFPGFDIAGFGIACLQRNFCHFVSASAAHSGIGLIKTQHIIVRVQNLDTDTAGRAVSTGDSQNIAIRNACRTSTVELIIDLGTCPTIRNLDFETVIGEYF